MARKKDRYPSGNRGADGDFRFDQIEGVVASDLTDRRCRDEYQTAFDEARRLLSTGASPEEVRKALTRSPHLQDFSPEDHPRTVDWKKAHNRVEKALAKLRECGVEMRTSRASQRTHKRRPTYSGGAE